MISFIISVMIELEYRSVRFKIEVLDKEDYQGGKLLQMKAFNMNPETMSGFFVDENRKKVWKKELEILEQIMYICKKYDITYVTNGGTTIGTIRHGGFIPWDDDIDLMMKRKDYDKFIEVAQIELKEPYFLQCYKTEKIYYRGHVQVRDSSTTAIIKSDNNDYNKGIWVDIFPMDNIPDDLKERERFFKSVSRKKKLIACATHSEFPNLIKNIIQFCVEKTYWKIFDVEKAIEKLEKYAQKYNNIDTKACTIVILGSRVEYENDWFDSIIEKDFEYLKIPTIEKYDQYLTKTYGDYMEIPKIKPGSMHGNVYFDTEKSYKEYTKEDIKKIIKKL